MEEKNPEVSRKSLLFPLLMVLALAGGGLYYGYASLTNSYKLGPPPPGWTAVGATKLQLFYFRKREARVIRCDSVNRVFMHEPDRFTVYIQESNSPDLVMQTYSMAPKIVVDVPLDKPIWMQLREMAESQTNSFADWEIHIHSNYVAADISGAGWESALGKGKPGIGSTVEFAH